MRNDEVRAVRFVRLSGAAVLALGLTLFALMPATAVRENLRGVRSPVIGFELATTPAHVFGILGSPDDPSRAAMVAAMDRVNRIDFLFMIAYPAFTFAIALWLAARGAATRAHVRFVGILAVAMWAGDLIENLQLLKLSQMTDPAAMGGPLFVLRAATRIKWGSLFLAAIDEGSRMRRDAGAWRWIGIVFRALGMVGLLGLFFWLAGVEQCANLIGLVWLCIWILALRAPGTATSPALAAGD
jgi:hypothetical protein